MLRGLYTAASGMLAAQTQSEIIADNVANTKTTGYKEEKATTEAFPSLLLERLNSHQFPQNTVIGTLGTGVRVDRVAQFNLQGEMQETKVNTDLSLASPGLFAVQAPEGVRYTRNGHFQLANGELLSSEGYPVLGVKGPLQGLDPDFKVNSEGVILNNGVPTDNPLQIVDIPAENLERTSASLYQLSGNGVQPQAAANAVVRQGMLEGSNVSIPDQMVNMISVMRAYEANQKVIQTQDATLEKAVNEIGKI